MTRKGGVKKSGVRKRGLLGIDIGGTKLAVALEVDGERFVRKEPIPGEGTPTEVIDRAVTIARELTVETPARALGVSIGGPLDHATGRVLNFPHLPGWRDIPLAEIFAERLELPTLLDNDANLAGLAEYRHAVSNNLADPKLPFVYLTLSTGIGGGVIIDGRLLHGVRTGAGELGHITVAPDGPLCPCGNRGCLERMASGTHIGNRAREMARADRRLGVWMTERVGGEAEAITAETVVAGYRAGDPLATEIWLDAISALAIGLGSIIHVLAPGTIVLGGGLSLAGNALLDPLRESLKRHVFYVRLDMIEVATARLGHDSALVGALGLAGERMEVG